VLLFIDREQHRPSACDITRRLLSPLDTTSPPAIHQTQRVPVLAVACVTLPAPPKTECRRQKNTRKSNCAEPGRCFTVRDCPFR
jgi:hypothetical protein